MLYEYTGVVYPSRSKMCAARREHYVELLRQRLNFTQAAKAVAFPNVPGKYGVMDVLARAGVPKRLALPGTVQKWRSLKMLNRTI